MKKYKLLKDLPFAAAGEMFIATEMITFVGNFRMFVRLSNKRQYISEQVFVDVDEWFEEVVEKWPKHGDAYYYAASFGDVYESYWADGETDNGRLTFGNVFRTREEAEKRVEWLKAWNTLENSSDFKPDWDDEDEIKYFIYYDNSEKELKVLWEDVFKYSLPCYLETLKEAEESIRKFQKEWKIIMGVEG